MTNARTLTGEKVKASTLATTKKKHGIPLEQVAELQAKARKDAKNVEFVAVPAKYTGIVRKEANTEARSLESEVKNASTRGDRYWLDELYGIERKYNQLVSVLGEDHARLQGIRFLIDERNDFQ